MNKPKKQIRRCAMILIIVLLSAAALTAHAMNVQLSQDGDGGYFVYNCKCSEADYAKLVPGTKVKVTGVKANYADEIEIADGEFQIETDVTYIAEATDLTSKLATDDIVKYQNMFASFKGLTVEPIKDGDGVEHAWIYNWDGSGEEGSDIYFNVSIDGKTFHFLIESYLCDSST